MTSCGEKSANTNRKITIEAFSELRTPVFTLSLNEIKENIKKLCLARNLSVGVDSYTNKYYLNEGTFLWIDRFGVDTRVDTLLSVLKTVGDMGFSQQAFYVDKIEHDLNIVRNLEFDDTNNRINDVMASLEYHLTKAFLRYSVGQSFGFINPEHVLNRIDTLEGRSQGRMPTYRRLFDIDIQHPNKEFFKTAFKHIQDNSIGEFMYGIRPADSLYYRLQRKLKTPWGIKNRVGILCNMERCRWQELKKMGKDDRYVFVNIPAFHLYCIGDNTIVDMMVGCGAKQTKTPLLTSTIERMDVNPVWNIPMSIIRKDISSRAGDTAYFKRNRFYIVERETGKLVSPHVATQSMLVSGAYRVIQEGGDGNSLGRIVFRFPNKFSVFLHDTSSKGVFDRKVRSVSHGCVRVQNPYGLATFLLPDADEWTLDKLRISMGNSPETERGIKYVTNEENSNMSLIKSLSVKPCVPLYISYYTIYPDISGELRIYPDIYGYDEVIHKNIKPFVE